MVRKKNKGDGKLWNLGECTVVATSESQKSNWDEKGNEKVHDSGYNRGSHLHCSITGWGAPDSVKYKDWPRLNA